MEDARRVFVLCWQGRSRGLGEWRTGWRYEINGRRNARAVDDLRADHLPAVVARLKHVQLECDTAAAVIARYDAPSTCFYLDPPYVWETRSKHTSKSTARYAAELDEAGHRDVYEAAGWRRLDRACLTDHGFRTECLWFNPAAAAALPQQDALL